MFRLISAVTVICAVSVNGQTLEWVTEDLGKLGGELIELEGELRDAEARARNVTRAHSVAEHAWAVCVAFGKTTDEMSADVKTLEGVRKEAEMKRAETELHRTRLEVFHGVVKVARVDVEEAQGRDYDRQLLQRYINPMRATYFPMVKSVIDFYDAYEATITAYQAVFRNAGTRCKNKKSIGQWLVHGAETAIDVGVQLSATLDAVKAFVQRLESVAPEPRALPVSVPD